MGERVKIDRIRTAVLLRALPPGAPVRIDRIRTDVLLWALGGFGDESTRNDERFPDWLWKRIGALAQRAASPYGAVAELAEESGRSRCAIYGALERTRRNGLPSYMTRR
jgi:hypothetical protein